jgi:hypothetical protein
LERKCPTVHALQQIRQAAIWQQRSLRNSALDYSLLKKPLAQNCMCDRDDHMISYLVTPEPASPRSLGAVLSSTSCIFNAVRGPFQQFFPWCDAQLFYCNTTVEFLCFFLCFREIKDRRVLVVSIATAHLQGWVTRPRTARCSLLAIAHLAGVHGSVGQFGGQYIIVRR